MASMLKKKGYSTAAIGKWHLGYGTAAKVDFTKELKPGPLEIGFDYHFGVPSNHGDVAGVYVEDHRVYGIRSEKLLSREQAGKNFKDTNYIGIDAPPRIDDDVMPMLTNKVVQWLEKQTSRQAIFPLLYAGGRSQSDHAFGKNQRHQPSRDLWRLDP